MRTPAAPGGLWKGRPGAFLLVIGLLGALPAGCEAPKPESEPTVLELEGRTVQLGPGVALVDVLLRAESASAPAVAPDSVRIRPGDVVRFVAGDDRPHAVAFEADRLTPEARAFLVRTNQLRSPPLIHEGAAWVLSFADAPPGLYPFVDASQDTRGVIVVAAPDPAAGGQVGRPRRRGSGSGD